MKVIECFETVLTPHGFKKRRIHFSRLVDDVAQVLSVSKSRFADFYILDYGVFMRSLAEPPKSLAAWNCHLQFSPIQYLEENERKIWIAAMNEESANENRLQEIQRFLEKYVLPSLALYASTEAIEANIGSYPPSHPFRPITVLPIARKRLDLPAMGPW